MEKSEDSPQQKRPRRITLSEKTEARIYNAIHAIMMDQRLYVARNNNFSVDVDDVDTLLRNQVETIHCAVIEALKA